MANYRDSSKSCGFTEAAIRSRATSTRTNPWKVRCLNESGHEHGDRTPSAYYYADTGWYGCHACDASGFATDRLKTTRKKSMRQGNEPARQGYLIPSDAELVATYDYKQFDGNHVHRVQRWEWYVNDERKKSFRPQHRLADGGWVNGAGKEPWQPYNAHLVAEAKHIFIAEGEKCADALNASLPQGSVALTSAFGSKSAHKTDWSAVINTRARITLVPDSDDAGEHYKESVVALLGRTDIQVMRMPDGYHDIADFLQDEGRKLSLLESSPYKRPGIADSLDTIAERAIEWLWTGMLPRRKMSMLIGKPGVNKSTLALWLAARLSCGEIKGEKVPPCNVLIYSSEDDTEDTILPRVRRMGAQLSNVHRLRAPGDDQSPFDFTKSDHVAALVGSASEYDLIILDPVIDICGDRDVNSAPVVRRAIATIIDPLCRKGCAVLGVHHERKDARRDDFLPDRAAGSHAWSARARMMWLLHKAEKYECSEEARKRDLGNNAEHYGVLTQIKTNIAKPNTAYHVEMPQKDGFITVEVGEAFQMSPNEALAQYQRPTQASAQERLAEYQLQTAETSIRRALDAVKAIFDENDSKRIVSYDLHSAVKERAGVGRRTATDAINGVTMKTREGQVWYCSYISST